MNIEVSKMIISMKSKSCVFDKNHADDELNLCDISFYN